MPTQSLGKQCRVRDLRPACAAEKEVVKAHALWWHFEMKKIEMQSRKDPSASSVIDGGRSVLSAWVAEERNRVMGRELTEAEERVHADLLRMAQVRELEA